MNQPENQTVGEKLRLAREAMGISIEDAARATHIRVNYLLELENDHPEVFASGAQARGFLRLYASFLQLLYTDLIDQWESPSGEQEPKIPEQSGSAGEQIENIAGTSNDFVPDEDNLESDIEFESINAEITKQSGKIGKAQEWIVVLREKASSFGIFKKIKTIFSKAPLLKLPKREIIVEATAPQELSEDIFKEIGDALRARRQKMDLDLTDVEHFTNLKRMYLIALEDGRFADLPSTVQGRGMLNNYAQFLAMDEASVMDRYVQALQMQREERMPPVRRQVEPPVSVKVNLPEGIRRMLNPDLVVGGALILALFGFIIWGASQILGSPDGEATEAPSISEMLQVTPSISPTPDMTQLAETTKQVEEETPVPGVAIIGATPTPIATVNAAPLQLYIIANDRAYMRITVDGIEVFDGRAVPNNAYTYSGNSQITLLTGNASALEVYFNQEYLGRLGDVGEVVDIRFAPSGLSTATPRTTPTVAENPRTMEEDGMMEEGN